MHLNLKDHQYKIIIIIFLLIKYTIILYMKGTKKNYNKKQKTINSIIAHFTLKKEAHSKLSLKVLQHYIIKK